MQGYVIEAGRPGPGGVRDVWAHRGLWWAFAERELKLRYRQAVLGMLWALAPPLTLALLSTLVFHRWLGIQGQGPSYPLFAFLGLLAFTFFHACVLTAAPSLVNNAGLIRRMWFPRQTLALAALGAAGVDLLLGAALALAWMALAALPLSSHALLALPLTLILVAFTAGLALIVSAWNVYHRDVKHALPLLLQLLFFGTPLLWPTQAAPPAVQSWLALNPLAAVADGWRRCLLERQVPDAAFTWPGAAVALLTLALGWGFFRRAERRFADVV